METCTVVYEPKQSSALTHINETMHLWKCLSLNWLNIHMHTSEIMHKKVPIFSGTDTAEQLPPTHSADSDTAKGNLQYAR